MKKVTAIDWLLEQLKINNYISDNAHWLIDDAKKMEKQQIIDAWNNGQSDGVSVVSQQLYEPAKQYYNETYIK
jgi:hypothetical protein